MMLLLLVALLTIKHLICDFFLQRPYQYLNKGKYGHPGGLVHVGIAMLGSLMVFMVLNFFDPAIRVWLQGHGSRPDYLWKFLPFIAAEGLIHYHCDWGKVQINRIMEWHANNSEGFWWILGIDQFIHQMTYIGMAYFYYGG